MITREQVDQAIAGWQEPYVDFLSRHAALWRTWAEQSDSMVAGKQVRLEDVPDFFKSDYEWAEVVLDMGGQEQFNWNDPRIARTFCESGHRHRFTSCGVIPSWGLRSRLQMSGGIKTMLEIGAGRGNLSGLMLEALQKNNMNQPLVITDAHATVLDNLSGLHEKFPGRQIDTVLWDVNQPAPEPLDALSAPVLLYERASLTYANFGAIENLARVADVLVLGDYFNYTGELFAYDLLFERIGLKPLMYRDVQPLLERCFSEHIIVDRQVQATIGLPNVSLIVAWK